MFWVVHQQKFCFATPLGMRPMALEGFPMKKMMGCFLVMAAACGGPGSNPDGGGAHIDPGTVQGFGIDQKDTQFFASSSANNGVVDQFDIMISDTPKICENVTNGVTPKGSGTLWITLGNLSGSNRLPVTVGTYSLPSPDATSLSGLVAGAHFDKYQDGTCPPAFDLAKGQATSGTVTVKTYNDTYLAGEFDLKFVDSGDKLSGSFVASKCGIDLLTAPSPSCTP